MDHANNILIEFKERIWKKKEEKLGTNTDQLNGILKFINTFAFIVGLEFIDDRKPNRRIAFACFVNLMVWPIIVYSIITIFPSKDIIIFLGIVAFNITVWTKLSFINRNHKKYMSMLNFIFKVVESNSSGPRERIFMEMANTIRKHLKTNLYSFLAGAAIYAAYPCFDFVFNGNLTLVSPLMLPFVNPETLRGYFINSFFNIFLVSFSLAACIAISSLFFASVDAYDGLVSLIEQDFGRFDDLCENKEHGRMNAGLFRNIMTGLSDLARFNSYANDLYGVIATVQVSMSCMVVVIFAAACLAFDYVNGIGAALTFYTEMLMYCFMGQILDNTNKRIVTVISNAKWYTYEVKYQKDMMTALYVAQNLKPIRLANVAPLNFATGLKITNDIYSFLMFLLNMFA